MKKSLAYKLFVAACLVICAVPFVCMTFARTDTTTENKNLAELPALIDHGSFNTQFLPGLGDYFNDHFAFRQQLVSADAEIQSRIFKVSNVDTVIAGRDGWLYYTDDLDDYLGRTMEERAAYCAAYDLALAQAYVEKQGAKFLVTVPPNKSTLYGGHMPYYDRTKVSDGHNYEMLQTALADLKVNYLDLFELFGNQPDVLYLKRDSHWDNRGALLAYNAMMDALGKKHPDFGTTPAVRTKTEIGDLGWMLYPVTADPEWNVYYEHTKDTSYITDTQSVEDAWIQTGNRNSKGALLMYRDSFGNTLIPFAADAFAKASFSKMMPYDLAGDMEKEQPDYVIIEKVERNITDFASDPPVIPAPKAETARAEKGGKDRNGRLTVGTAQANMAYWQFDGELDEELIQNGSKVCLTVGTDKGDRTYAAFLTCDDEGHYGCRAYLPKEKIGGGAVHASVTVETQGTCETVCEQDLDLPEEE